MPAAESEGQIGVKQAAQIGVIQFGRPGTYFRNGESFWQSCEEVSMNCWKISLVGGEIIQQVRFFYQIVLEEYSTAHDVKKDVCEMVRAGMDLLRNLQSIRVCHIVL